MISQAILIEAKSNTGNEKIEEYVKKDPNIGYALKSHGNWDWQLYTATHTPHEFYAMLRKIRSDLADHIKSSSVFMLIQDFKFDFTPSGIKKILRNLA